MQVSIPVPDVKGFFQSHSNVTHAIAAIGTAVVTAYYQVPQFQALVLKDYAKAPASAKELIVTTAALYAFYKSQKSQENQPK